MSSAVVMPLKTLDPVLSLLVAALAGIGLVAIASASVEYGDWHFGNPWHHTLRHGFYLTIALVLSAVAYRVPLSLWQQSSPSWLLVAMALLILVLIPGVGRDVNGSQRWLPLGPLTVQPSEIVKFALALYTAGFLVRHEDDVRQNWQGLAKPVAVLCVIGLLLLAEPDFGATVISVGTVLGMLFLAGARLSYVLTMLAAAVGMLALLIFAAPYRLQRLTAYTDPWSDPFGSGFQLIQSLIAYGRGDLWGVGLGNSVQKLFYLPEAHTDFVFSIWAEETGLFGALLVMVLYAVLIARILQVGRQALCRQEPFSAYFCYGVALIFSGQVFVNMGVSSGLLPTKGLTLPLISYGGSSLIVSSIMLAIVLRVAAANRQVTSGATT